MEGFDGEILLRAEYSIVSHSLHIVWLWVCISSHLLKEVASLMMAKQGSDL